MSISATVTSQPIAATVSPGGTVSASVSSATAAASVTGGLGPQGPVGPQGPQGPAGPGVSTLGDLSDVVAPSPAAGDVLRYASNKWRSYPETDLTLDGGNW